jgi:LysM repeat protein
MISLVYVFYIFVVLSAVVGAVRGWAKETLVLISALLAIFIIFVFESYVGVYQQIIYPDPIPYTVQVGDTCELVAENFKIPLRTLISTNNLNPAACIMNPNTGLLIPKTTSRFYVSSFIIMFFAFFGYQTPAIKLFQAAARREKVRDMVLGGIFGAANGYLIWGSIWWFLNDAGYENFEPVLSPPLAGTKIVETAADLIARLPPEHLMQAPLIYFLIALAFGLVLIVYI